MKHDSHVSPRAFRALRFLVAASVLACASPSLADESTSFDDAVPVAIGSVTTGILDSVPSPDEDYVTFEVTQAGLYVFYVKGDTVTTGYLYNASRQLITQNGVTYHNFRIEAALQPGIHFLRISGYDSPGKSNAYDLHIEGPGAPTPGDDHGDSWYSATPVSPGSVTLGTLQPAQDLDFFRIEVATAGIYVIFTRGALDGNGVLQDTDTVGALYDGAYQRIASAGGGGETEKFRIQAQLNPGTYYVRVEGEPGPWGYIATGPYALHIEGPGAGTISDDHGFSWYSATPVAVGSATPGAIDVVGDQDYFRFDVAQAGKYVVFTRDARDASGVLRSTDTQASLYDASLNVLMSNNTSGENGNFRMEAQLSPGTYYVQVTGFGWPTTDTGPYMFHVEGPGAPTVSDDHGSSWYSATPVSAGTATPGVLNVERDQDYFRFTVPATGIYVIYTRAGRDAAGVQQYTDTDGALYDGSYVAVSATVGAGESVNFRIECSLASGTYYVRVTGRNGTAIGPYELHIEGPGAPTVSDDHGFSWYSATPVAAGTVTHGMYDIGGDQDYFRFAAPFAGTYVIYTRGALDQYGVLKQPSTDGALFNASYQNLVQSTAGGEVDNFRIEYALTPGIYYVRVTGYQFQAVPAPYDLHIEGPGLPTVSDDHGFSWHSATDVAPGTVTGGVLDLAGDQDYFRFTVQQPGVYVIFTRGAPDGNGIVQQTNTSGSLYNASLQRLQEQAGGGEATNFRIEATLAAGTYYVRVFGNGGTATGPYRLHIEGPGAPTMSDDHGSSWYSATPVGIDSITPGAIDLSGDLDFFSFTVPQSGPYLIYTRGARDAFGVTQNIDTTGVLYNSSYQQVASATGGGELLHFRISANLSPGTYYVRVSGGTGPYGLHVVSPCGPTVTGLSVTGVVRDGTTGLPLPGVTASLESGTSSVTDAAGRYTLTGLSTGLYRLTFMGSGYPPDYRTIKMCSTSVTLADVRLTSLAAVFGFLTSSGYAADPVNTSTGNYAFQRRDLSVPGIGLPFVLERGYNSQDIAAGPLGYGWTHSLASRLASNADNSATVRWGDGKTETWVPDGAGGYRPPVGVFDNLVQNGDGTYAVVKKSRTVYRFDAAGRLSGISDRNGNAVTLTYSGSNLSLVTDTAGRQVTFAYDGSNRITTVTDPIGRTVQYAYDVAGDLVSSTDPAGHVTTYAYDFSHQLLTVVDPRGNTIVSNTYDSQNRVVTSQRDAKGGQTSYSYDPQSHRTTMTNALGQVSSHDYDDLFRLAQATHAGGSTTGYVYDEAGNRTEVRDRNGNTTRYAYDSRGNVTLKTDAPGNTTAITYDSLDNPLSRTNALGNTTSFEYDGNGNLTRATDPLGHATSITYDMTGLPLSVTDANGRTTIYEYDADGNLIRKTDPLGGAATATYDGVGRRLSATDALGRTTSFAWDNVGNLLSVTDALGNTTSGTYDGNGNRLSATDPMANTTRFAYDAKDLLSTVTDAFGRTATASYDALDRKTGVTDRKGNATEFAYDVAGNMVRTTDALGHATSFTYDGNGNRLTETDPSGSTTAYGYDALNRVISRTDALGNRETVAYDNEGRVVSTTNAKGQITRREYDAAGQLARVTDPAGGTVTYAYDNVGNRTRMTDPNGNATTYEYDRANRLTRRTEPLGNATSYTYDAVGNLASRTDATGRTTSYTYDVLNRLIRIAYPNSTEVTFAYDKNGNRTQMVDGIGTSTYTYDALNRMLAAQDAFGKTLAYGYDFNGNVTTLVYPDGKTVTYAYDALDRMASVTDWQSRATTYTYDAASRLTRSQNPNGTRADYGYDAAGRLTGLSNRKNDGSVISSYAYTLDPIGNHLQVTQTEPLAPILASKEIASAYDAENRLLTAGPTTFTYDGNGNMTARGADTFAYDPENRLTQSTIAGASVTYRYDGSGRRMERTDGTSKRYVVDVNRPLPTVLAETDGSGSFTAYYVYGLGLVSRIYSDGNIRYYHFDFRGSTVALTDPTQAVTDTYAYDPFGKVLNSEGATPNPFRYVGRYALMDEGNGLLFVRARWYSQELGRFLTKDPLPGNELDGQSKNRYAYAFGNPVRLVDPSGYSAAETAQYLLRILGSSDPNQIHRMLTGEPSTGQYEFPWWYQYTADVNPMVAKVVTDILKSAPDWKIVYDSRGYWRRAPRVGTAGTVAKALEYLTPIEILYGGYKELQDRGYRLSDVPDAYWNIKDNVIFAYENPDAFLMSLEEALTSTTAVVWNNIPFNPFETSGTQIQEGINKYYDAAIDWFDSLLDDMGM